MGSLTYVNERPLRLPIQKGIPNYMAESILKNAPIMVIDPEIAGRMYTVRNLTDQQLTALEDCDFIIIHPLLNLSYVGGVWEPVPLGTVKEMDGVMTIEKEV